MESVIRKKEREDCKSVARVVTLAWQQTYKGIINDDFLNGLTNNEVERSTRAYDNFNENNNNEYVLEVDGEVVGFVKYGEAGDQMFKDYGEINALYILNGFKGFGYGKQLYLKAIEELKKLGFTKMIISCIVENPSNEFYKHTKGRFCGTREFNIANEKLIENIYEYEI